MTKWDDPQLSRYNDIIYLLERAEIRERRNTRHILRVMCKNHAEIMEALNNRPKAALTFGKPQPKLDKLPDPKKGALSFGPVPESNKPDNPSGKNQGVKHRD